MEVALAQRAAVDGCAYDGEPNFRHCVAGRAVQFLNPSLPPGSDRFPNEDEGGNGPVGRHGTGGKLGQQNPSWAKVTPSPSAAFNRFVAWPRVRRSPDQVRVLRQIGWKSPQAFARHRRLTVVSERHVREGDRRGVGLGDRSRSIPAGPARDVPTQNAPLRRAPGAGSVLPT